METRVPTILAICGILTGAVGIFFFGALALIVTVLLFGAAIIFLDGEIQAQARFHGPVSRQGWSPTCPGCGLDILGSERVCPHCGRTLVPAAH